jgi:2',3'-cyclic-nucleotide 2'-phosphodiesterase
MVGNRRPANTLAPVNILFFADVCGRPGRRGLAVALPQLRDRYSADLVIANGENAAGGVGITERTADELFGAGVDVITTGNHVYRHREVYGYLDRSERIIRPANYPAGNPGRGHVIVQAAGRRLAVLNLSGAVMMKVARSPFVEADALLARLADQFDAVVVDFHAEVTSEKVAMGWHLDGRVAAVIGTHTHVPTSDARVLPAGTAHISDAGMTGSRNGILGARRDQVLEALITQMPVRFDGAEGDVWVNAVAVEVGPDGLARSIEQILEPVDGLGQ